MLENVAHVGTGSFIVVLLHCSIVYIVQTLLGSLSLIPSPRSTERFD